MALVNTLDQEVPQVEDNTTETAPVAPVEDNVTEEQTPRQFAGRFNSVEDLEKGYEALNSQQGKAGQELGELRNQMSEQSGQMAELLSQQQKNSQPPANDYEAMQADLADKYESGDIDFPTYSRESNALTAQVVQENAQAQTTQILDQAKAQFNEEQMATRFHDKNPEYAQLQASGAFEEIKAANEFITDDYQAYLQYQASEAMKQVPLAREEGKNEATKEISGSQPAGNVASSPGSAIKNETPVDPNKKFTKAEVFKSGLAAWDAAGG